MATAPGEQAPRRRCSRDSYFGDLSRSRALSDVEGQLRDCLRLGGSIDRPPDGVSTGPARGERGAVTERALVSLEGREHDAAFWGLVFVVEDVPGHPSRLPHAMRRDIGGLP